MRLLLLPTCVVLFAIAGQNAKAADSAEYNLKAAFLFKFVKYVEWPPTTFKDKDEPFVIGVLGDNPFGNAIDEVVRGREVAGRKMTVKRYGDVKEARAAQVLFVTLKGDKLKEALRALEGLPVLTVGERDEFLEAGGMIRFYIADDKIGFDIENETGKKAGLAISAQLLRLARPPAKGK